MRTAPPPETCALRNTEAEALAAALFMFEQSAHISPMSKLFSFTRRHFWAVEGQSRGFTLVLPSAIHAWLHATIARFVYQSTSRYFLPVVFDIMSFRNSNQTLLLQKPGSQTWIEVVFQLERDKALFVSIDI